MVSFRSAPVQPDQDAQIQLDRGVFVALTVLGIWAASLFVLLTLDITSLSIPIRIAGVLLQTFLYTGLFITAHDAMHGAVAPSNRKLNDLIGSVALSVYALFSLKSMIKTHWEHHAHPASEFDPDFHNGKHKGLLAWYSYFMVRYWSWTRIISLVAIFHIAHRLLHVPEANLTWFWVTPSILSSVQLFFFGTFLPHREPEGGYQNESRAMSTRWSPFWSFLSCYHFGYHLEHHERPDLAWWQLPELHQRKLREEG
ncbi:MAG: fatty acid desaturase [Leptolyngbya sp. Prado105]|nr:fatty acid desaturase [Leptolyngbya sp. Prado105]